MAVHMMRALFLLICVGQLIACSPPAATPGEVLQKSVIAQGYAVRPGIVVTPVKQIPAGNSAVATTIELDGRVIILSKALTYLNVVLPAAKGPVTFQLRVRGPSVSLSQKVVTSDAPNLGKAGPSAVQINVGSWTGFVPGPVEYLGMTSASPGALSGDYDFAGAYEFSANSRASPLCSIRQSSSSIRLQVAAPLAAAGYDRAAVDRALMDLGKRLGALSDRDYLMAELEADGKALGGEKDLAKACEAGAFQVLFPAEWAIEFQYEGSEVVAVKLDRKGERRFGCMWAEFNPEGHLLASGSVFLSGSPSREEVARAVAVGLGSVPR